MTAPVCLLSDIFFIMIMQYCVSYTTLPKRNATEQITQPVEFVVVVCSGVIKILHQVRRGRRKSEVIYWR